LFENGTTSLYPYALALTGRFFRLKKGFDISPGYVKFFLMPPPQTPDDPHIYAQAPELVDQTIEGARLTQAEKQRILDSKQLKDLHAETKPGPPQIPPGWENYALYQVDSAA
jgi:hypothetical protein